MPIFRKKNGEITPFRNAKYISAFCFIPKNILDKCGEEINGIPRNPRKLLRDPRAKKRWSERHYLTIPEKNKGPRM